jgi:hypothetical protein
MAYKMSTNRHKGRSWEEHGIGGLFDKLRGEIDELAEAVVQGNFIAITLEAADVANYAMMIAEVAINSAKGSRINPT